MSCCSHFGHTKPGKSEEKYYNYRGNALRPGRKTIPPCEYTYCRLPITEISRFIWTINLNLAAIWYLTCY